MHLRTVCDPVGTEWVNVGCQGLDSVISVYGFQSLPQHYIMSQEPQLEGRKDMRTNHKLIREDLQSQYMCSI